LVALVFAHLYCLVEVATPHAFAASKTVPLGWPDLDPDRRQFLLVYFSLCTLTTVGYGDVTPATDLVRGLAVIEAVLGQFYLAVIIADLVGKRAAQPADREGPAGEPSGSV